MMRAAVPIVLFLLGAAVLLYGIWQLSSAWACIVGGLLLVVMAWVGEFSE